MSGIIHANGVIGLRDRLGPPGSAADDPEAPKEGWHGRVQLRRENVERGTSEETTRTYFRSDNFLSDGMLSFQVASPDAETGYNGSPVQSADR